MAMPAASLAVFTSGRMLLCSLSGGLGWRRESLATGDGVYHCRHVAMKLRRSVSLPHHFPGKERDNSSRPRLTLVAKAVDSPQPSASNSASAVSDKAIVDDDGFTLAKVSFGVIGLAAGCTLLTYGFGAYFSILPGSEWSALMLTYGFPLAIIGMALKGKECRT